MSELKDDGTCHPKETCSCATNKDRGDTSECSSSRKLKNDVKTSSLEVRCEDKSSVRDAATLKKECPSLNCSSNESRTRHEDSKVKSPESKEEAVQGDLQVAQSHVPITCQSRARSRQDSESTTSSHRFMCRICHGGEDEEDAMISPCLCSGSLQYCHQDCLLNWLGWKSSWTCELCSHGFSIVNHGLKRPTEWKCVKLDPSERWSMVVLLLALSAIIGSTYFLIWSFTNPMSQQQRKAVEFQGSTYFLVWSFTNPMSQQQRKAVEFQVCYALYVVLNLFSVGIVLFYVRAIAALVNRWRAINQRLQVQDYAGRLKKRHISDCSSILVLPTSDLVTSSKQPVHMDVCSKETQV